MTRLPYPFGSPWIRDLIARYGLPLWFAALGPTHVIYLWTAGYLAIDARIYVGAARLWLSGGNPWGSVQVVANGDSFHFAAPPVNLVPLAPLGVPPELVGVGMLVLISAAAGVYLVRVLGLPWWWLLFPPLLEGMQSGNPQILLVALLIAARGSMFAPLAKIYAIVPLALLGRQRDTVAALAVLGLAALVAAPLWPGYIAQFGAIAVRLQNESNGGFSAWAWPVWVVPAAAGVIVALIVDRKRGAWLAIPALWPASEFHYSTLAMPVMTRRLAYVLAIPLPLVPALAVIGVAASSLRDRWTARREQPGQAADDLLPIPPRGAS